MQTEQKFRLVYFIHAGRVAISTDGWMETCAHTHNFLPAPIAVYMKMLLAQIYIFSRCRVGLCSELKELSTHHKNLNSPHAAREQKQKSFDFFAPLDWHCVDKPLFAPSGTFLITDG